MASRTKKTLVALVSLGCPKNLVDSEKMMASLAEGGCVVGAPMDDADVIVVNTCGFLSAARQESLDVIAEAVAQKRRGRARRVVVAGCLVNRDAEKLFELAPGIDAVVGVNDRDKILAAVMGGNERQSLLTRDATAAVSDAGRFRLTAPHTAYLRISEGCSRRCSFCTIPAIRGPFRSKPVAAVLREARELIASGAVELNIIGQDTTSYGWDWRERTAGKTTSIAASMPPHSKGHLAELMWKLDRLRGVRWLRLLYAYPNRFDDAMIDCMAAADHIVPYVDIPLQHVNDAILKAMRRGVTRSAIERLLEKLRRHVKGITIRTTFIVGFPGETDEQFEELLSFVKDFRFDALGVFEYSREPGTAAADMSGQVPAAVKRRRARAVMAAQQKIAFAANGKAVGASLECLVDGRDGRGRCVARHRGQAPDIDSVCYLAQPREAGSFVTGTVTGCDGYDLVVEPR
ncbi:MAG: 30S ribosomal protein S12 methylthiotransferase RimO [Planctomycetaceae bacterium]|nr:30S ribosomal protein S12 methylthiotransferase RimO [Planctomycetaceae bacterium]